MKILCSIEPNLTQDISTQGYTPMTLYIAESREIELETITILQNEKREEEEQKEERSRSRNEQLSFA